MCPLCALLDTKIDSFRSKNLHTKIVVTYDSQTNLHLLSFMVVLETSTSRLPLKFNERRGNTDKDLGDFWGKDFQSLALPTELPARDAGEDQDVRISENQKKVGLIFWHPNSLMLSSSNILAPKRKSGNHTVAAKECQGQDINLSGPTHLIYSINTHWSLRGSEAIACLPVGH